MKDKILEQIDKLKLMYLMEQAVPHKSAVEQYDEWVSKLQGRHYRCNHYPFTHCDLCDPTQYAEYKTVETLVEDLYRQKYGDGYEYQKNEPEIRKIISVIVAMTMYIQEVK